MRVYAETLLASDIVHVLAGIELGTLRFLTKRFRLWQRTFYLHGSKTSVGRKTGFELMFFPHCTLIGGHIGASRFDFRNENEQEHYATKDVTLEVSLLGFRFRLFVFYSNTPQWVIDQEEADD